MEEIRLLISIWRDENVIRMMDGTSRDRQVYEVVAAKSREKGLERTAEQCHNKIKRLRAQFKSVSDNNRRSGRARKTMPFYDELAELLGDRPAVNPENAFVTESIESSSEDELDCQVTSNSQTVGEETTGKLISSELKKSLQSLISEPVNTSQF
ncbi:uncharacterized protein [Ptychodera flava]|uniref:uncharacterized protein n=1 Tax=Ptychodera flava TaxID=63121 RepID=UPI00396A54AA